MHQEEKFDLWAARCQKKVDETAERLLPLASARPEKLHEAMRYCLIGAGKRVRPLLVYAAGIMLEAQEEDLDRVALAVECVHSYSLIHDDMPCMDNDLLRHGKPTAHAAFGEAMAMLAGDALQPQAMMLLVSTSLSDRQKVALVRSLAKASSTEGMCGGQAIDLEAVGRTLTLEELTLMHRLKTGALLASSVELGALCGKEELLTDSVRASLAKYGASVGLAFQIVDDILDVTSESSVLGKTAGKDEKNHKPTYVSLLGLKEAQSKAQELYRRALEAAGELPCGLRHKERLAELAGFIIGRTH